MNLKFLFCCCFCVHVSYSRNIGANHSAVLISKYAKVAHWGVSSNSSTTENVTTLTNDQSQGRSNNGQSFWTHRSDVKIANRGQNNKPSVVYASSVKASNKIGNHRKSENIPGVGEVLIQDRFNPRPYFDYAHVPSKVMKNNAKSEKEDSKMPGPVSYDGFPVFSSPKPDLYTSGYNSYNPPKPPPQANVDAPPSDGDIAYPPNAPPPPSDNDAMYPQTQPGDDSDNNNGNNNGNKGYSYDPPPKDSQFEDSPHPLPPPPPQDDEDDNSYQDHPPKGPEGPPKPPYSPAENHDDDDERDVYYPPSGSHPHQHQEVILDHPPPGWKDKPEDSMPPPPMQQPAMPMEKPTHDMAEDDLSPPPSDPNYEGRFPQYLYSGGAHGGHDFDSFYDHDHHHVYKEITTTTTEAPEDERVNKGHYSYYYLGRKLWYIPLYFSVYFIIYVTVLILKSIARHKIDFKHNFHYNRKAKNLEDKVDDLNRNVTSAIATSRRKFEFIAM